MLLTTLKSSLFALIIAGTIVAAETATSDAVAFNNLICPVSGKPAKTAHMGAYNGVVYRFCCAEHIAAFQQSPQQYLTNLPNNGVITDLANEVCPVSGQPAQKDVFVVIDGCKVHAKCAGSSMMLRRFPAQYLARARRIQGMTPEQLKKEFVATMAYNNSTCPVTGKPSDRRLLAVYSNIVYRFSSVEARAAFTNTPMAYLSKLPNNGRIVDMGNEFCPDAGDPVDKKLSVVVEGKRIYVGCKGCAANVLKDPQGYITRVEKLMAMTPEERKAEFAKKGPCENATCPTKAGGAAKETKASPCATCPSAAKGACPSAKEQAPAETKSDCATCPSAAKGTCPSVKEQAPAKSDCASCPSAAKGACPSVKNQAAAPVPPKAACATCPAFANGKCDGKNPNCKR